MKKTILFCCLIMLAGSDLMAQFYMSTQPIGCVGECNGFAGIGYPAGVYRYHWNTGDTTPTMSNLCAGVYYCIITDTLGARLDSLWTYLAPPSPLQLWFDTVQNASCTSGQGALVVTAIGGTPPYQLYVFEGVVSDLQNWSGAPTRFNNLQPASYSAGIYDEHMCEAYSSTVTILPMPVLTITEGASASPSTCTSSDGNAPVIVGNGTPPYEYYWSQQPQPGYNGDGTDAIFYGGNYNIVVYDSNGCSGSAVFFVNNSGLSATAQNTNITCLHADSTTINIFGTDPSDYLTILWMGNYTNNITTPVTIGTSTAGINFISVQDYTTSCQYYIWDTVIDSSAVKSLSISSYPACTDPAGGIMQMTIISGEGPFTYLWNNGATTSRITNLTQGNYSLTVTDGVGCKTDTTINLYNNDGNNGQSFVWLFATPAGCGFDNGTITADVVGGTSPYQYQWSTNPIQNTPTAIGLRPGNYIVTVTDNGGCMQIGNITVDSGCYNVISGTIFEDLNTNCALDSGEFGVGLNFTVTATGAGGTYYGNVDQNGNYSIFIPDTGTYTLSASMHESGCGTGSLCATLPQTVTFTAVGDSSLHHNYAVQGTSWFDLTLHPGWTMANPGFQKEYWAIYYNQGMLPYLGPATIVFTFDSNLVYLSSNPAAAYDAAAHTLTWNVDSVPDIFGTRVTCFFDVPSTLSTSYLLQSKFVITPTTGDCDSSNNVFNFSEPCTGSHDPNEKDVMPAVLTGNDSVLTYSIHFQNTGTASTHFIIVTDTLSKYLDPASVLTVASSATYSDFKVSGSGILSWTFNPIYLPDSLANPSGSKGFITFTVKKKSDVAAGTNIGNTAYIYFDYNAPVITNTTITPDNPLCMVDSTINMQICQGTTYSFNDSLLSASGTYYDTLLSSGGCDSVVTLNLTVMPVYRDTTVMAICPGQTFGGHTLAGFYSDTLSTVNGCDSILVLNLTLYPVYADTTSQTICTGQTFEGHTAAGFYSDTLSTVNGCDSILVLNLALYPVYTDTTSQTICTGQTFEGHTAAGFYSDTLSTVNGCDSILVLNLTLYPVYADTTTQTICPGQTFEGHTAAGFYSDTLSTMNGCDSILVLNLTVGQVYRDTSAVAICAGLIYEGHSTGGFYSDTLSTVNGCDSIQVLNLTVITVYRDTLVQSVCAGQAFDGYSAAGVYSDTLSSQGGCDSITTVVLTVNPVYRDTSAQTICSGQTFDGHSAAGYYSDTLSTVNGCDSILVLNLTVNPVYRDTLAHSICAGTTYQGHSTGGFYSDTLNTVNGCDSILVLNLTVITAYRDTFVQSICTGQTFNGYSAAGVYNDTLSSQGGCDSIITVVLTVYPVYRDTSSQAICEGLIFEGHGASGIYSDTLTSVNGCDSILTVNLTVLPVYRDTTNEVICNGQTFGGHGATGVYSDTLSSINGCDSILVLNLTVNSSITSAVSQAICQGQSYAGHSSTGIYVDTITSLAGCDSIVTLNLTVNPVQQTLLSGSVCSGNGYLFNDTLRTITNIYTAVYNSANGCDSVVTLNLVVLPNPLEPYITRQGDSLISSDLTGVQWYFNDSVLAGDTSVVLVVSQPGVYQLNITGPNGCPGLSAPYVYFAEGIDELTGAFNVMVYPNPNNGNFIIEFSDNNTKEVIVTDMLGQTVMPAQRIALKSEINLSGLASGVYMLRVSDVQNVGKAVFKQLVIQH